MGQWASVNGVLKPEEDAVIHALAPGVKYAAAVFEGVRAYWDEREGRLYAFRLADHMRRLFDGMRILRFEPEFDLETAMRWARALLAANRHRETAYFRILAFIDGRGEQSASGPVSLIVTSAPLGRGAEFDTGFRLGVSSWTRISDRAMPPRLKSIANYHNGRLGVVEAQAQGYDYPLFLTEQGKVAETAGSCVFMRLRSGEVATPDRSSDILESVTRDAVIHLMAAERVAVVERKIDRTELYLAEEVFVVGTHQEVCPVVAIDGLKVGNGVPGAFTRWLQARFLDLVEGRDADPYGWREPIDEEAP